VRGLFSCLVVIGLRHADLLTEVDYAISLNPGK
jgi:hypothetical protein